MFLMRIYILWEGVMIIKDFVCCPLCGDEVPAEEVGRFSMCLDCFADGIACNVDDNVLFDFLREYGREFRMFISDNYDYC